MIVVGPLCVQQRQRICTFYKTRSTRAILTNVSGHEKAEMTVNEVNVETLCTEDRLTTPIPATQSGRMKQQYYEKQYQPKSKVPAMKLQCTGDYDRQWTCIFKDFASSIG